ncbi:MAG: glycosyltransferase [Rhodanobacter sp.]|jgi:GT2 family glycosyltransferase|nr:glycosyltransferase [Rhodanobacter sp.]
MFSFPHRPPSPPSLGAPLRAGEWDGHTLSFSVEPSFTDAIALDLDGSFFDAVKPASDHCVRFEFAYAPSGQRVLEAMPRLGRDGQPLADKVLHLWMQLPGFGLESETPAPMLAPLLEDAAWVPFRQDVAAPDVVIVVPVYNAPALVGQCLDSVLVHTDGHARLLVIDDASPDPEIAPLLAQYAKHLRVKILRNVTNRGFTATANRGIVRAGKADVVLLNADTRVGPNWLTGLRRAAYSGDDVATATAVSDNAGAFSVPELERENALPAHWSFDDTARAFWQQAGTAYPELPTGNGFCLYIRRSVIDAVGTLDEEAFPQGYGEENDFCQRASHIGLRHVIAGNVLVGHARSQSFGVERRLALGRAGMAVLRERWPAYEREVGAMLFSFARRVLDWRVRRIFARARGMPPPKPRLLWIGAHAPTWPDMEVWNLRVNGEHNELVFDDRIVATAVWQAEAAESVYRTLCTWLQVYAIECLIVADHQENSITLMCEHLAIPVARVDTAAATAAHALQRVEALPG